MADFDKVVLPGQEGNIAVKIYGHKLHSTGRFTKSWTVKTNDPENSKIVLQVTGTVIKVFDISKNLSMSGYTDEELTMESIITSRLETPIHITDTRWEERTGINNPGITGRLGVKVEKLEKGKKYRVKVWQKEFIGPGHYVADLVLLSDFENLTEKRMPVRITIMPDVEVHPRAIIMREMFVPRGKSKSFDRIFRIIAARGDSLKVELIPASEEITVNVTETTPGKAYRCKLMVRPPSKPGRYTGMIMVRTNYPGYEVIELPITGSVRVIEEEEAKK